ncbi:hypothetical protein [Streptomyces sp. GESEQ-35]|uniref:hypothetical protein n=1 Tax=Streptomyces sp. GESEQ-35 TaxID=2812657 RepID=UPI001B328003|nr:hypothetical protein [Streptomyces sp. GESEQ-35]
MPTKRLAVTLATALAAVVLTAALATGCDDSADSADNAIDCRTDNDKLAQSIDDLNQAMADYNKAILNGDTDPDTGRIDAAADAFKDVCTP